MKYSTHLIRLLFFLVVILPGQTYTFERNDLSDQYIDSWVVGGPFIPASLDMDFFGISVAGGEKSVATTGNLSPGSQVSSPDGSTVIFKEYSTKGNIVDFVNAVFFVIVGFYIFC